MNRELPISLERIPSDTGTGHDPVLLVATAEPSSSTTGLYRRFTGEAAGCRAGENLVVIASTGALNSPDLVAASGRRHSGSAFKMALDIRRYDGPIRANDPWIALVRMDLGSLDGGRYAVVVEQTTRRFTDRQHPERATNPVTIERRLQFNCD